MRVVSGSLGGRTFDAPRGHRTHPMGDKIRGALFNILGDISGLDVLDCYSGSGALSIEAVSRGAASVIAVEADKVAYETIQKNIATLKIESITATKAFVRSWLNRNTKKFDIVIADPPYDDLDYKTLERLPTVVKPGGILIYSVPPHARIILNGPVLHSEKSYGDAKILVFTINS